MEVFNKADESVIDAGLSTAFENLTAAIDAFETNNPEATAMALATLMITTGSMIRYLAIQGYSCANAAAIMITGCEAHVERCEKGIA